MVSFLHNLGLFVLRLVTGSLVSLFAAREMANRSAIIVETLEFFSIGASDIVKVFVGCLILILGVMIILGIWTRVIALLLLLILAVGVYCRLPQASPLNFQIEALYGVLFFYLLLVGGGKWAVSRRRTAKGQSVLESEQSILSSDKRPSILKAPGTGQSRLAPPIDTIDPDMSEEGNQETSVFDVDGKREDEDEEHGPEKSPH